VETAASALAADEPDTARLEAERALSVTRLPLLPGENSSWVEGKRRELADVRARALDCLAEACLRSGDHSEAARWAEEAIEVEPFRETGYRQLMQAHAIGGNRAEALRVYERCRHFLADELGAYPSPETESIYRELSKASTADTAPTVTALRGDAPTAERLRKIVTVLVWEVVDAQKTWDGLDAEAIEREQTRYRDAVARVVERHGGVVKDSLGDAVAAVFGVPQLHEDDALRALRAALELPRAAADLGLRIRVGVDSGEAIVDGTNVVAGNVIAAAARLQRMADPGDVFLGDDTHRLVAHAVHSQLLEPVGADQLTAWRLLGLSNQRQFATPFVGRERELRDLRLVLARAVEERRCEVCTIAGPPGIGKSRLADRFLETIRGETTVLVGRCLSYGEGITYWPIREIVQELSGNEPRAWIESRLSGDTSAAGVAERIASAVGAGGGGAQPTETFWAFRKLFEALASDRPLVLAIDDVHWAEPTLLDLFDHVASFSASAPILLLCLARPELFEKRAEWAVPHENRTVLSPSPLRDKESRMLVDRLGGAEELSEDARVRAVETAEGNPLFLEQLVAHESEGASALMPQTIHALLGARIDGLGSDERSALERAAICGRTFESEAVAELLPDDQVGRLGERLLALIHKDFILPGGGTTKAGERFRFRHILVREAAYEAMPKELRADLHERHADRLAARRDGNELIGYHLEQAARYLAEVGAVGAHQQELARRATESLGSNGRAALRRGDVRGGVNLLARAVSVPDPDTAVRLQFLPDLAEACSAIGEHSRANELLSEAAEGADANRDSATGWRARLQGAWLRFQTDPTVDVGDVLGEANACVRAFGRLGDDRDLGHAWHLIAWINMTYGRLSLLADAVERGRQHARAAGDAMTRI
jgi:class 3 adenylate cyclase